MLGQAWNRGWGCACLGKEKFPKLREMRCQAPRYMVFAPRWTGKVPGDRSLPVVANSQGGLAKPSRFSETQFPQV